MSRRVRLALGLAGLAVLAGLAAWAVTGLPDFGHPRGPYADLAPKVALRERDIRGFDTLGEELILCVAAIGAAVLLRAQRSEEAARAAEETDEGRGSRTVDVVRALGAALVGPMLLLGLYFIAAHGVRALLPLLLVDTLYFVCAMIVGPPWGSWMGRT